MRFALAILTGSLLWGLAWWPIRQLGGAGLTPLAIAMTGYGAAVLVLLPAPLRHFEQWWPRRRILLAIAVTGACWNLCFVAAMGAGEVSRLVLLYYLSGAWAVVGGRLFLGESLDGRRGFGLLLAIAGAWLVLNDGDVASTPLGRQDLLAMLAGMAHAATNLLFRAAEEVPVAAKNASMFLGTVLAAGGLFLGGAASIPAVGPSGWLLAAAFGLGWVLAADTLVQFGVSHLPASRSAVLAVSELPFTVLSAALLVGERLTGPVLAGGALIAMASLSELLRHEASTTTLVPEGT